MKKKNAWIAGMNKWLMILSNIMNVMTHNIDMMEG
jgi:hypothetical protein